MIELLRIKYDKAEKRIDEAIKNGTYEDIMYWRAYRDGVAGAIHAVEEGIDDDDE